jgi:hypothetical protein
MNTDNKFAGWRSTPSFPENHT